MFEVNVNIPALDKLADALNNLANTMRPVGVGGGTPAPQPVAQAPTSPQMPAAPVQVAPAPIQQPPATVPAAPAPVAPPPAQAPVAPPATYTLDQLSLAAVPLMDAGRGAELMGLMAQFGVQSLQQLRPEQYGAVATALRGLGAAI